MKHIHRFKHIGGGCGVLKEDKNVMCDDDYQCITCGEKFRVYTSFQGHAYLPREFESREFDEADKVEFQLTKEALDGKGIPDKEIKE